MREREQKNSCSNSAKGKGEGKKFRAAVVRTHKKKKIIAVILKLVRKRNTHKHLFPCRSQDISFTFFCVEFHPTKYYCWLSLHFFSQYEKERERQN